MSTPIESNMQPSSLGYIFAIGFFPNLHLFSPRITDKLHQVLNLLPYFILLRTQFLLHTTLSPLNLLFMK